MCPIATSSMNPFFTCAIFVGLWAAQALGLAWLDYGLTEASSIPADWRPRIESGNMLYTQDDGTVSHNNQPILANGMVSTTINDQFFYVSGVFNGYLTQDPSHRAAIPSTVNIPAPTGSMANGSAIDFERAVFFRRSTIPVDPTCSAASTTSCTNSSTPVVVEQRWFAHRTFASVFVHETAIVTNHADSTAPNLNNIVVVATTSTIADSKDVILQKSAKTCGNVQCVAYNGSTLVGETHSTPRTAVHLLYNPYPNTIVLNVSHPSAFSFSVIRTSLETPPDQLEHATLEDWLTAYAAYSSGELFSNHTAQWQEGFWSSGLETDRKDVAVAMNTSLFALYSAIREDRPYSLSPGGLTPGYNGHTFWDCETWMFPVFYMLHGSLASSILQYRVDRLDGAREKAKSYDPPYRLVLIPPGLLDHSSTMGSGTMFPWESAFTGEETCPTWAATGLREIHISGDIAFAVWQFWRSHRDLSIQWLRDVGFPILQGVADFWLSKATPQCSLGQSDCPLSIDDVIPPDEYADHVNNSAFTNAVARLSLEYAVEAAKLLGQPQSTFEQWEKAAPLLNPPFDPTLMYHPEYDGYNNETIKQADVILLGFPLDIKFGHMNTTIRKNDLDIYGKVTSNDGPAMTWGMQAIGYIELGEFALANSNFNRSFANIQQPFGVWSETPTGGTPNFITGAGGFLQGIIFGWSGGRLNDTAFTLSPNLPAGASYMKIRGATYLGNKLNIRWNATMLSLEVMNPSASGSNNAATQLHPLPTTVLSRTRPDDPSRHVGRLPGRSVVRGFVVTQQPLVAITRSQQVHNLTPGLQVDIPVREYPVIIMTKEDLL